MTNEEHVKCSHGVAFDVDAAKSCSVATIRAQWPRGYFTPEKPCPQCRYVGIAYASMAHYVYGDW